MSKNDKPKPKPHYAPALQRGLHEVSHQVEAMHRAIAGKTFGALKQVPVVAQPAALIESIHDAVSTGIHAAVRLGNRGLLNLAGRAESALASDAPPGRRESGVRAAINGVFGDHVAANGEALATPMQFFERGKTAPVAIEHLKLRHHRVCIFLHGLACDEHCWTPDDESDQPDYGARVLADFGYTPLYLRYNTGLPIADNAAAFAEQMESLVAARPDIEEFLLIGHSMGGLVARSAFWQAAGAEWLTRVRMLICLGSPQLGSPLERLGMITNRVLDSFDVTAPIGAIARRRSAGIRDLHDGIGSDEGQDPPDIELRFLGATIAEDSDSTLGKLVGDGLVTPDSALAERTRANVARAQLGGLGHMAMLHDARVWQQIRTWIGEGYVPAA
ncbi:alpha/beta fold hydrolase [Niveibacterium umoris]|uniref:Pimeloyl-ACP methyl ester carboxylesterase n=1 Tax=Niveibacterium umoris TaxID=1193620 RepID=A0A840BQS2_9RHOO|nr:alpha/beta hydrolase [Niveibacterium umoris]MBB4013888.1 pimeloyl-ACP methyl ester carboxylesterase [Niveibacterium umoris]